MVVEAARKSTTADADAVPPAAPVSASSQKPRKSNYAHLALSERGYMLGELLGKGGFGQVNRVTNIATGEVWAVKMISKATFSTSKDTESMKLETELMKRVRGHPNVVELKDVFEDRAFYYIVMELCLGGELMDRIVDHQHFSEKVAAAYFRQMLQGVKHCHDNLVVHRDLKPENFLFDALGPAAVLKLTDFGLSCGIKSPDEIITEACGSAYYIAPEVFKRRFTKACDVWSCGIILYLMLSGTVPFGYEAEEEMQVYESIQRDTLKLESRVWNHVSASARELVCGLLEKDPAKRYTLEEALAHPWTMGEAASDSAIDRAVVKSMLAFNARNKFKKEALKLIASTLSAADVQKLRQQFHAIDTDNTGTITFQELRDATARAGADPAAVEALMKEMDTDGDGTINYSEFIVATTDRQLVQHQNNIWWAFCEYDTDGDGKISADELAAVLKESPEQVRKYMDEFDADHDGTIDYEEFMRMVLPKDLKYKISRF